MRKIIIFILLFSFISLPLVIYADNHTGLAQASIYSALNSAFSLLKSLLLSVFQAISYQQQLATISQVISSGLFSYWNFDEGSGNIAQDISGNGNTLNLNNNPNWIDGKINKAISFNGVDQYGSVASLNLSNTNQVSISFWGILSTDSRSVVYELTPNYNQFTTGLAMFINDTPTCNLGQVSLVVKGDDGYNIKCYNLPTDRVWHHYVAIYDKSSNSANEVNLYIDNVLQAPSSQPYYADNTNNFSNSPFYLMSREGIYRYTNGSIDDLRIYNRLLSASDINSLYSLGSGTTSPPPVTDTTPPSTPTNLTATPISSSQINLSWTASTDNVGVASYRLERCQGSSCTSFTQIATPTGTTYSDTGLSANTSYNYRVRAADAANNLSGYSNTASATTLSVSGFDFSLSTSGSKSVVQGQSVLNTITATLVSGLSQSVSFSVSGLPSGANSSFSPTSCTITCSTTLTINTSLTTPTGNYPITITASGGGISKTTSFSLSVNPVTDTIPPSTPTNLTATPISSSQINLSWTASTDNVGVASYRLERCQGSACTSFTQIATPTGTTYSDTGLSANTSYNYRVRAADAANNLSNYSNTASATTWSTQTSGGCDGAGRCYVRAGATGLKNGSDWTNAYTSLPTTLQRGVTYYIADGNYGGYNFTTPASGTTFIYIKKATIADHGTDVGWQDSYGDGQAVFGPMLHYETTNGGGYIDLNGYSPHVKGNYGFKIDFDKMQTGFDFVRGGKEFKFRYIDFDGVASSGDVNFGGPPWTYTIKVLPWDGYSYDDTSGMLISHCALHGSATHIQDNSGNRNIIIEYSDLYDNRSVGGQDHGNIYWIGSSGGIFRYNKVYNYNVEGLLFGLNNDGWQIYGNVFYDGVDVARGIELYGGRTHNNMKIYGNTFVNIPLASVRVERDAKPTSVEITNNLMYNSGGISLENGGVGVVVSNNSIINDTTYFVNYANKDYRLAKSTPTIGKSLPSPYNVDAEGKIRGADGYWDIGAYEYVSGVVQPLSNYTLTVSKSGTGSGTITGTGINCGTDCTETLASGTTITLTATPNTGSTFAGWSGACSGTANTCTITITDNTSVTATFNTQTQPPVTDTIPPSTPTNLTATPISSSQINLSWTASTDNVGVASYRLERCQGSACTSFTQIATPTGTTYSDTGLSANTSYNYRVRAADAANNLSGYSNTASATTFSISTKFSLNDRVQTTAVLNVRATPSLSGNLLGTQTSGSLGTIIGGPVYADGYWWWNVNYDTGFDGWSVEDYLEKYTVGSNTYTLTINALNGTVVKNPNQDSYPIGTVVTLTAIPNSEYVFSKWSGSLTGTANPITITMDSNKTITANFSLKSYVLTINALNGSVAKSPSKSYYLSGEQVTLTATPNSGYHFVNWSGDLTESINPIVITMDSNKTITANFALNSSLASPQNLTAEVVATNKVRLRWQDTANDETNYLIERAVAPTGPFVVIKTLGANYKTYTDTVPVPGVTYYYRVYAFNSVGKSDYSNVISVTVTPPIAPILLSVISKTPTQVALTWQDNSDNENGFKIEQRRLGSNYTTVATLGPNVTTYIRSSLSSKTTYYFRIRAYNGAGYSSYSNEISITTP